MPRQVLTSVENNFTKGLITEATGLNFPENAATSASNCIFTLIGDVIRRQGINFEANGTTFVANRTNSAMSSYVWNNPGGDGNSKLLVKQIDGTLYFYNVATATTTNPISTQLLIGTVSVSANVAFGATFDPTLECTYVDGNGYLIVFQETCDPFFIAYNPATLSLTSNPINVRVRDFAGLIDGLDPSFRPPTLSTEHNYNLQNQGWVTSPAWTAISINNTVPVATIGTNVTFTIAAGIAGITNGQVVSCQGWLTILGNPSKPLSKDGVLTGTVVSYVGTTLTINLISRSGWDPTISYWNISPTSTGYISTWFTAEGNYPSNSDIWWLFKDSTGAFNPATTQPNVQFSLGNAPKGHFITSAWLIDRGAAASLANITVVDTLKRPTKGAWYAGRVWYTGVSDSQAAQGDANYYTWTENIYFSQTVQDSSQFGNCFQTNDPTSQTFNGLLPTDGGVIVIVGSGTIHKLFPIANGLLVFANNGIWFITGSQGIGFSPTDYTVTKISSVRALSSKSFIDVLGLPFFWNEEGIYRVVQGQGGSLTVDPITVTTILSFYNNIPMASKLYARGSYDPISYTIQWCFRSTPESSVTDRYQFDSILNFNVFNKAFFPYNISSGNNTQFIHDIQYISFPVINPTTPLPGFWYPCSQFTAGNYQHGLAQEYDPTYNDWSNINFTSSFTTGYKLHGQGIKKVQIPYVYIYTRNTGYTAYNFQTAWEFATAFDANRWSQPQYTEINESNYAVAYRRHKTRGRGEALQLMLTSVTGQPFDIVGWTVYELANTGV